MTKKMKAEYTDKELTALRALVPDATEEQFTFWLLTCRERGMNPGTDILLTFRRSKERDKETGAEIWVNKSTFMTTIGALRKVAESTGKYSGQKPTIWIYLDKDRKPTVESTVPLPNLVPYAVRVGVMRTDFTEPLFVVARYDAYAQTYNGKANHIWSQRGPEMTEKCGEALALRKAFPEQLSGLYVAEELQHNEDTPETGQSTTPAPEPIPEINQIPAEGKDVPRPGEKGSDYPTAEEKKDFTKRFKDYKTYLEEEGVTNASEVLKAYKIKFFPHSTTLTTVEWKELLGFLDLAKGEGIDALKKLLDINA